jgi:hypothetical protein
LASIAARDPTSSFDPTNKSIQEIVTAVKFSHLSKADAVLHFTDLISQIADGDTEASTKIKKLESAIKSVETVSTGASTASSSNEGCLLYVLARLSKTICTTQMGATSFDLCVECDGGEDEKGSRAFSSTLARPRTLEQLSSLLNLFIMVSHASGIANVLAMTRFLDEVIHEPLRMGVLTWPVAFECLILYLRMVESHGSTYHIATVVHTCGGLDAIRQEATNIAHEKFGSAFFRTLGGKPKVGGPDPIPDGFDGRVKGDNPSSTKPCASWNLDKKHLSKHVGADGKCKFKHGMCDQYVSDKGPGGICGGAHKRPNCDYDAAKKVSQPAK